MEGTEALTRMERAMSSIDEKVTSDLKFALVPEWFIDSGVSDKAFRLYTVLAKYADNEDRTAYPGRRTLARRMGCSLSSVDRALEELIDAGAVTKKQRCVDGRWTSSLYTVHKVGPSRTAGGSPTHDATPSLTHATTSSHPRRKELDQELDQKELLAAAPPETVKKERKADPLWDTMLQACNINPQTLTGSERGRINKALKELREVGATPDELRARAKAYTTKYPGAALTPTALSGNWSQLQPARTPRTNTCQLCAQPFDAHDEDVCLAFQGRL